MPGLIRKVSPNSLTITLPRKWFMQGIGHEGLNNLLAAYEDKSAVAVCTFAFSPGQGQEPILFQGRTNVNFSPFWTVSLLTLYRVKSSQPVAHRILVSWARRVKTNVRQLTVYRLGCSLRVCWRNVGKLFALPTPTRWRLDERYAEMDKVKKNMISHRAVALRQLREWLEEHHATWDLFGAINDPSCSHSAATYETVPVSTRGINLDNILNLIGIRARQDSRTWVLRIPSIWRGI